MEVELEPRVKPLSFKVKGISRESPTQKAANVLDSDLRTHWSSGTNTKEWILLELDEPCLLSHIRIYNKSVLEWEIAVGLRYKPETFIKVRPRCEAPRRDMMYPMNYTPCRYVRISCLRGNPIAIFFIQLIGVTVTGLEAEFQPVANHLLPQIISHKQDAHDLHLQLLQDMTNRLLPFLPQLEGVLTNFSDAADSNLRFLAMLAGPFYPILHMVKEREEARSLGSISDNEVSRNNQPSSSLTVSSNFEPRRSRNASSFSSTSSSIVFRPDVVFLLLRKAYNDSDLGTICRMASRILKKLVEPCTMQDVVDHSSEIPSNLDEEPKSEFLHTMSLVDYSELFGPEFSMPNDRWDTTYLNVLDLGAVEEGIMHVLYACVSQPTLCSKLAEGTSDIWSVLPLVQALLPALRPFMGSFDNVDDNFAHWKQHHVQRALSQIVVTSSSPVYRPLLHACAGYLSSYSPSHAKAACVLMDLCSSVLAPWMPQVVAKVDLAVELLEEFLGTIQGARICLSRARAALKCIVLALSGHMDDILRNYKEVKHKILFLVEMLEPFLDPAITKLKSTIAFGDVSSSFPEKQERNCIIALNIIRKAVRKPAVLPSLEAEWRRGAVAPSVLLSVLDPHMQLPPQIDLCKSSFNKSPENVTSNVTVSRSGGTPSKSNSQDELEGKTDAADGSAKLDVSEDVSLFFAPPELQNMVLTNFSNGSMENSSNDNQRGINIEDPVLQDNYKFQNGLVLDVSVAAEYTGLQADYFQLRNYHECELRASEFQRLSIDLHSQQDVTVEGHEAAIDALLLAAECYVNPYFILSLRGDSPKIMNQLLANGTKVLVSDEKSDSRSSGKNVMELEKIGQLEGRRDKIVLQLLLQAADLDKKYYENKGEHDPYNKEAIAEQVVDLSLLDSQSADAVTLLRQNQALLCSFLIHQLQREQQLMHEILMHSLAFLLYSATKLYCAPESVVEIILKSAECLNGMLTSFYCQLKEGNMPANPDKIHGIQRRWMLLQKLVIASTAGDLESQFAIISNSGCRYGTLISPSAWMQRISSFAGSSFPLVRFLGWMAVSRNAKQYIKDRLFLASDLAQLKSLLSIFADDLAVVENVSNRSLADVKIDQADAREHPTICKGITVADQKHKDLSFPVIYPDLCKLFPNMKLQFETFGETILEAVGLQLKSLPSSSVPDILCWFSELCLWPFSPQNQTVSGNSSIQLKGYEVKNAKAIILYILEAIVVEHMEAMVPEIPRVVQVLESLCRASYCDVSFIDAILRLLKPIISYTLCKVPDDGSFVGDSCLNFESLCFDELFVNVSKKHEQGDGSSCREYSRALAIFVLGTVFPDLSFPRKREILQSLVFWADFAITEPPNSFHDYLCAFQCVLESCNDLAVHNLRVIGVIPQQLSHNPDVSAGTVHGTDLSSHSSFLYDVCQSSGRLNNGNADEAITTHKDYNLSVEEIEEFARDLEVLISKLNPSTEFCWRFHHQLTKKLTISAAECLVYIRCLSSSAQKAKSAEERETETSWPVESIEEIPVCWTISLKGLAEFIIEVQKGQCWEVASVMLDCLLGVPYFFCLDNVIGVICSAIKKFCCSAPKITWRLASNRWLSMLCERGIHSLNESEVPLIELFCTLLGHFEPEQRFIALQYLGKLIGQDVNGGEKPSYPKICNKLVSPGNSMSVPEQIRTLLVRSTWDRVAVLASSDTSFPLRIRAMALLVDYIPFTERHQLQSFLLAADTVLHGMRSLAHPTCEGPLVQISIALLAGACLYCPADDTNLIPQSVWQTIEIIGSSKIEGKNGDTEKRVCQVLCNVRDEGEDAKEVLKQVLASDPSKQCDMDFGNTRESILQVLSNFNSVQSYFDVFSRKTAQEVMELEEAELELDILQKEHAVEELSQEPKEGCLISSRNEPVTNNNRIQQIKDQIRSLEKSKLKENVIARRQQKLQMRHARQKYLEEAALWEAELLQELDRERTAQAEREIERQRQLELERAKTRELRYNLDMEKERQTQRELQRELEQAETGVRLSRRDFPSSTHSSRPRERYRERDNGRSGHDGSGRTGQVPTILQSRERLDECGSSYEENLDGSKDSGDTCSVGDSEMGAAFDGQPGGFGSAQRHGSRGGKSRQVIDRREREGRREGKWERKH